MAATPPGCVLVAAGQRIPGTLGSSVWGAMAVDRTLVPPQESVAVPRGTEIRFELEGPGPTEVFLWVYRLQDLPHPARAAWEGRLDPVAPTWDVDIAPGPYVLALFREWPGRGDAAHHFRLDVLDT